MSCNSLRTPNKLLAAVVTMMCLIGPSSKAHAGQPAARVGDGHTCPLVTGIVPHVGGPILPPGVPTVLIGGAPAAVVGGSASCVGPLDTLAFGSATVLIGGAPAVRKDDMTAHAGIVTTGLGTVLIGPSAKAAQQSREAETGHHPQPERTIEDALAELRERTALYDRVLHDNGESSAVRNALANAYLVIGSLYEGSGDSDRARVARAHALAAIEPAVAEANRSYVLVTYVQALVLNGRTEAAGAIAEELQKNGWVDPHLTAFCELYGLSIADN